MIRRYPIRGSKRILYEQSIICAGGTKRIKDERVRLTSHRGIYTIVTTILIAFREKKHLGNHSTVAINIPAVI